MVLAWFCVRQKDWKGRNDAKTKQKARAVVSARAAQYLGTFNVPGFITVQLPPAFG
jgi:hypothetical protein